MLVRPGNAPNIRSLHSPAHCSWPHNTLQCQRVVRHAATAGVVQRCCAASNWGAARRSRPALALLWSIKYSFSPTTLGWSRSSSASISCTVAAGVAAHAQLGHNRPCAVRSSLNAFGRWHLACCSSDAVRGRRWPNCRHPLHNHLHDCLAARHCAVRAAPRLGQRYDLARKLLAALSVCRHPDCGVACLGREDMSCMSRHAAMVPAWQRRTASPTRSFTHYGCCCAHLPRQARRQDHRRLPVLHQHATFCPPCAAARRREAAAGGGGGSGRCCRPLNASGL